MTTVQLLRHLGLQATRPAEPTVNGGVHRKAATTPDRRKRLSHLGQDTDAIENDEPAYGGQTTRPESGPVGGIWL